MRRVYLVALLGLAGCAGPLSSSLQSSTARLPQQVVLAASDVAEWSQDLRRTLEKSLRKSLILSTVGAGVDSSVRLELQPAQVFQSQSAQLQLGALIGFAAIADAFERHPGAVLHVLVAGSADADLEAPVRLAARQASSLKRELLEAGVLGERLRTEIRDLPEGMPTRLFLEFRPVTGAVPALAWMPPSP